MTESRDDKLESEYEYERGIAAAEALLTATVDLECDACGLSIHEGDPIMLGAHGWVHPVCAAEYQADLDAERRHDLRREGF
jgi:hypothetical protein